MKYFAYINSMACALPLNHEICVGFTTFSSVSSYPINDCKLWLICFDGTSVMNCISVSHNNPMLWALPFIQVTVEVILQSYSKIWLFECRSVKKVDSLSLNVKLKSLFSLLFIYFFFLHAMCGAPYDCDFKSFISFLNF